MKYLCPDIGSEKNKNEFYTMQKNGSTPSENLKRLGTSNLDTVQESKGKLSENGSFSDIRSEEEDDIEERSDGIETRNNAESDSET